MKIRDLPFHERPVRELLNLDENRAQPDANYAGYGWAKVASVWLGERRVDDVVILALHSADDAEPLPDDIELEFELPGAAPVSVLASQFVEQWLPQLPSASAIVLALCNPHGARLRAAAPMFYATGDVESWIETFDDPPEQRILLATDGEWRLT